MSSAVNLGARPRTDRARAVQEPHWPAALAALAVAGLYAVLPEVLSLGPRWLLGVTVVLLLTPGAVAHRRGMHQVTQVLGHVAGVVITGFMVWSVVLLVHTLPNHQVPPAELLRAGVALWISNVLVFASWYWRLDAGGPIGRDAEPGHVTAAFLFPQMTLRPEDRAGLGSEPWSPGFVDYLFLAFNTSTALSPTDTPVLSGWAKVLCMTQASISLVTVVVLVARAVNMM